MNNKGVGMQLISTITKDHFQLTLDRTRCSDNRVCLHVCPHGVFVRRGAQVSLDNGERCVGCGNCIQHCAQQALQLTWL